MWELATGSSAVVGPGTRGTKRYRVEVERATGLTAESVATVAEQTMADPRGWTAEGWAFQRVDEPPSQVGMIIRVATPHTVDRICLAYGIDTGGVVSCRAGKYLMINLNRWRYGIPAYSGQVDQYRHLVINHEAGHLLGYGHAGCPGAGRPAPVMMQQYYGLDGCVPNAWPFTADGTRIG